jgi:hypothetical protein
MALMSFTRAYVFLTKTGARRQTPCGQTLSDSPRIDREKICPSENGAQRMDIERINQIGNQLADLTQRTEALRGYL